MNRENRYLGKPFKYILYILLLFILAAFNFRDTMVGSWNPQYIYNTNGQSLKDMAFADSLNGYITLLGNSILEGTILKTTNGGNNWFVSYHALNSDTALFSNIKVFNKDSCLICNAFILFKTTNGGINWLFIQPPEILGTYYIYAFNFDTIWAGGQTGFNDPHLYLTTNGGLNWTLKYQLSTGSQFDFVYFYNKRIGFCSCDNGIYKTTNGGDNWFQVSTETNTTKIQFIDSLTGWKCSKLNYSMKKTTDGGISWIIQTLPSGGHILYSWMLDFSILNKDTIWGCGGMMYYTGPISNFRGMIWKTTNGGINWGYQIPDTGLVRFEQYKCIDFFNNQIGWSYTSNGGVHTTTGGLDSTVYVGIKEQNQSIASGYILYQNYPNPFNSTTNIRYSIPSLSSPRILGGDPVSLKVFNIIGKEIATLVNKKQKPGIYEVNFDGGNLSSGVYFYSLYVNGVQIDTKKTLMIK